MKKYLFIAALALLSGCSKNYPVITNARAFGTISGTSFILDGGQELSIVDNQAEEEYPQGRVFMYYDIMTIKDNGQDIRVRSWSKALDKDAVKSSDYQDLSELGDAPIKVTSGLISRKYVNLEISLTAKKESGTKHVVNLVWDDTAADQADTLRLYLKHDSGGESVTAGMLNDGTDTSEYVAATTFACFPMSSLPEVDNGVTLPVKISFDWYEQDDSGKWTPVTQKIIGYIVKD
ncbi:MAG: hypothetical protein IJ795_07305 [Bacteroidales bacterium]|nr:hypothetical protein [Bacteroidales bacterium]